MANLTPEQQALENNFNLPAGTAGSPWTSASVSVTKLANPTPKVKTPNPTVPTSPSQFVDNLGPVVISANKYQDGLITANTEESKQRKDVLSKLLNLDAPGSQQAYDSAFSQNGGNEYLKQFTDANTKLANLQAKFRTAGQKVSGAEGQSKAFEGVQLSEVDRESAIQVGNQAIVVQALAGNLDTARQIALDTSRFANEDRQAKLSNLIAQYNALDGIVQGQEAQLIEKAKQKALDEKEALKRVQDNIDTAITSGGATVDEMQQLTRTDLSNEDKLSLSQKIIARTAGSDREFDQNDKLFSQQLQSAGLDLEQQKFLYEMTKDANATEKLDTSWQDIDGKKVLVNNQTGEVIQNPGSVTGPDPQVLAANQSKIEQISNVLNSSGLNSVVGPNAAGRWSIWNSLSGASQNAIGDIVQLTGQLTVDNLIRAKAAGATFGALSDGERDLLANAATKIGQWEIKKDGKVVGYNASEKDFRAELDKINNFAKMDFIYAGGDPSAVGIQRMEDGAFITKNSNGDLVDLQIDSNRIKRKQGPDLPYTSNIPVNISSGMKGLDFNSAGNASASTGKKLTAVLTQKYPAGSLGGQCGDFTRKLVASLGMTYTSLGDSLASKMAAVKKTGTSISNAKLGSVIVTNENPTYGHVATIIGANKNGFIVAESNYAAPNKVSYGRVIPYNSNRIVGLINPHPIG